MSGPGPIGQYVVGAACAIFDANGRVFLVRHTYGRLNWELPGGVAQPGESPLTTATRELREETQLTVAEGRLTGVYFEAHHDFGPMLHYVFRFEPPRDGAPQPQPPEIGDLGWFALDALPVPISDFTERRIRDALVSTADFGVVGTRIWRE